MVITFAYAINVILRTYVKYYQDNKIYNFLMQKFYNYTNIYSSLKFTKFI